MEPTAPHSQEKLRVAVLVGATAVGKTAVALALAAGLGAEIVNADSLQVYRELNIGTAKPTVLERARIVHHLIDVADPPESYDAARKCYVWTREANWRKGFAAMVEEWCPNGGFWAGDNA